MAVKVADTIESMSDFPSMMAKSLNIILKDDTESSLQDAYDNGLLGGSGLPTPEAKDKLLLSVENEETSELEWSQVDKSTVGDSPFIGTKEEWEELSLEEKAKYKIVNFLDDDGSGESVDKCSTEEVKTNKVWIDGKPIYRRVIENVAWTSNEWNSNILSKIDVSTMDNWTYVCGVIPNQRVVSLIQFDKDSGLYVVASTVTEATNAILIMEYTKK